MECWNPPGGKKIGRPRDTEILQAQARRIEAEVARQDALLAAEAAIVKADELEVMARGSLIRNSERAKLLVSRLINRSLEELGDPEIKPRDWHYRTGLHLKSSDRFLRLRRNRTQSCESSCRKAPSLGERLERRTTESAFH
jgi:hypothetical protein